MILALAAITAGIALSVGWWIGGKLVAADTGHRALVLLGPHLVILAVLGAVDLYILYVVALSGVH